MKQKDVALIIVCAFISAVFSLVISNLTIGSPKTRSEKVEVVEPIKTQFDLPDKRYFNETSLNPTQLIRIGDNSNPKPFNAPPTQ
jgi:hypothetical protein